MSLTVTVEGVSVWWMDVLVARMEGEESDEMDDKGREGAGCATDGTGAVWFAAKLKTSRGDSDSWWGGGAVPGGGSRS